MKVGDDIFIYTSRGCYHNTSRDRGLLVGQAKLANKPKLLDRPVVIGPRKFAYACKLQILGMAPLRKGVELASVVDQLEAFPQPAHWSARLRQPPLELTSHDAKLLNELLSPHLEPLKAHLSTYEAEAIRLAGRFH
ncbi:hypothetical protein JOF56_003045 [Kibdelosporangium banguiense]|uniref:EVE domain-containing protein n=1 Tax=Kibdelosporangium banguiense TaxID=1365924 RepID=A0ABS4TE23_9PSEU|nr:hypothetical protein [Kibdelosporangium banguiense]MBP2322660.1 hypothetical protein [Kibdelosporangium banguiense]